MEKINKWEEIIGSEGFAPLIEKGIYKAQIIEVEDVAEKEYLLVKYDIIEGDYKGVFAKDFLKRKSKDVNAKWANVATMYWSYKQSALSMFKGKITAIEKNNEGYKFDFDEKTLEGKKFVTVISEEEKEYDGEVKIFLKTTGVRTFEALENGTIKIPPLKKLTITTTKSFDQVVAEISDDELPF